MAYQQDFTEEDKNKQAATGNETTLTPASATTTSAPGTAGTTNVQKPKGSGYTNLSQYVDANNPQASAMAGQITGGITNKIGETGKQAQDLAYNTQQQAQDAIIRDTQGVGNQLQSNPTVFNQQKWQDFYKQATQGYKGPSSIENQTNFQNVDTQVNQNKQAAENLKSLEGRSQAVQDQYAQGRNYTRGQNLLDSFLIGTGGGAEKLGQFQSQLAANDPNQQWQKLIQNTNQNIQNAQTVSNQTKQGLESAAQNQLGNISSSIQAKNDALNAKNQASTQQLQNLQAGLLGPDKLAQNQAFQSLGIDPKAGAWLASQGYDLNQLINTQQLKGLGDVVNPNDQTGYNALANLLGQQPQFQFNTTGGQDAAYNVNQANINRAQKTYGLDTQLNQRLQQQQGQRDQEYTNALNAIAGNTLVNRSPEEIANNAKLLGMAPEQYKYAMDNGLLRQDQLQAGSQLNLGDVATQQERDSLNSLFSALGLNKGKIADTQNEGNAYKFGGLQDILTAFNKRPNQGVQNQQAMAPSQVGVTNLPVVNQDPLKESYGSLGAAKQLNVDPNSSEANLYIPGLLNYLGR